jgi:hypothetical protein
MKTPTTTVVTYSIKPEHLEENRTLVKAVFEELQRTAPPGIGYMALESDSGQFLHIATSAGDAAGGGLTALPAFQAFLREHALRREGPLARGEMKVLGEYRLRGADGTSGIPPSNV